MKPTKLFTIEDLKLVGSFESVRKVLLEERFSDRLNRPLAFWALPNDRRLPIALLGRTIGDILNTPFEDLSATPGIGHKKIQSLVTLLERATAESPVVVVPAAVMDCSQPGDQNESLGKFDGKFDRNAVSELVWADWRETVRRHGLGEETLGRLAPTLQALPTIVWRTPLSRYLDYTINDIARLKTHGEKRIRGILEIFFVVHKLLSRSEPSEQLAIRLGPVLVQRAEDWVLATLRQSKGPTAGEIHDNLAAPLLEQIKIDAGPTVHELVSGKLGIQAPAESVRALSRRLGVTRARVYQLLDECCNVLNVRWPQGEYLVNELSRQVGAQATSVGPAYIRRIRELFYPEKDKVRAESA